MLRVYWLGITLLAVAMLLLISVSVLSLFTPQSSFKSPSSRTTPSGVETTATTMPQPDLQATQSNQIDGAWFRTGSIDLSAPDTAGTSYKYDLITNSSDLWFSQGDGCKMR